MTALRDEQVAAALAHLPGWQQEARAIRKVYAIAGLQAAMRFVSRVADLADAHGSSIEFHIAPGSVIVGVHTPGAEGVTGADLEFAKRIDR